MMMSEFIERTGYEPSSEEYSYIEEAYYDFDGNKDDFCKAWKTWKRNGSWARELKLRQQKQEQIDSLTLAQATLSDKLTAANESIEDYQGRVEFVNKERVAAIKRIKELEMKVYEAEQAALMAVPEIEITLKNGEKITTRFETFKFTNNNGFQFITVIEETGWAQSYKMDDIATYEIR